MSPKERCKDCMGEVKKSINEARTKFNEVINIVLRTVKAKGFEGTLTAKDKKTWKYATIKVKRWTGSNWVEGICDITVDNGVRLSVQPLSPFNPHGLDDLIVAIDNELKFLPWLVPPSKKKERDISPKPNLEYILRRFHKAALQLKSRHSGRETLLIRDEYDVQDLLHSLLRLFYDDIRPEESTPSKGGGSARVDFLLKNEKVVVEVKMASKKLKDKEIGEELYIDIKRYQGHPDCGLLICFVYDPEGHLKNPAGLCSDLSGKHDELEVKLIVGPEH